MPPSASSSTAPAGAADPAEMLRRVSSVPPADRIRLLKQAGDAYLLARGDLEGALHCYRQLLELASPDTTARLEGDDTWLLAALKQGQMTRKLR